MEEEKITDKEPRDWSWIELVHQHFESFMGKHYVEKAEITIEAIKRKLTTQEQTSATKQRLGYFLKKGVATRS